MIYKIIVIPKYKKNPKNSDARESILSHFYKKVIQFIVDKIQLLQAFQGFGGFLENFEIETKNE